VLSSVLTEESSLKAPEEHLQSEEHGLAEEPGQTEKELTETEELPQTEIEDDAIDTENEVVDDGQETVHDAGELKLEQMERLHTKMDANGDGKLSMPEILEFWKNTRQGIDRKSEKTGGSNHMEMMDRNRDGKVSLAEFVSKEAEEWVMDRAEKERESIFKELEAAKFKAADRNSDGFLDEVELPDAIYGETHDEIVAIMATQDLKRKDLNGDGELDAKEFYEVNGAHAAGDIEQRESEDWKDLMAEFAKLDLDRNGKLNREELVAWESGAFYTASDMREVFEVADDNKDSHVSLEELHKHLPELAGSEAANHLNEWAEHHEL